MGWASWPLCWGGNIFTIIYTIDPVSSWFFSTMTWRWNSLINIGLSFMQMNQIQDPVADRTYTNLWMKTAEVCETLLFSMISFYTSNVEWGSNNILELKSNVIMIHGTIGHIIGKHIQVGGNWGEEKHIQPWNLDRKLLGKKVLFCRLCKSIKL